jgi:hypothetical protein
MAASHVQYELRLAVEAMTAWAASTPGDDAPIRATMMRLAREESMTDVAIGLVRLAGILLLRLERVTGEAPPLVLHVVAEQSARAAAPEPPPPQEPPRPPPAAAQQPPAPPHPAGEGHGGGDG